MHRAATLFTLVLFAASASAQDKVRVLIIDGQNNHQWRKTTPYLKKALEATGRFTVDVATNLKEGDKPAEIEPTVPFPPTWASATWC